MSDDNGVPTGPFVSYGKIVGTIVAPGTSSARAASIGLRIWALHVLVGVALVFVFPRQWFSLLLVPLGFIAGIRYAANCAARHRQFMDRLEEEFEGDVHEI